MPIFYISDLHLRSGSEPAAQRFVSFLEKLPSFGDSLLLGGDIFDLFIGNKPAFQQKFAPVLKAIHATAQRGVRVHYLEGNHDFHLSAVFGSEGNVRIHADDFEIAAEGHRIWVSHGDQIDGEDHGYLLLRAATRSVFFRVLLKGLPGQWIDRLGSWSSRQSRKYNNTEKIDSHRQARIRALYLQFAREKVRAGYQHVLVGHSHLADQVPLGEGEYLNLGFARDCVPYAVLMPGGATFERRSLA